MGMADLAEIPPVAVSTNKAEAQQERAEEAEKVAAWLRQRMEAVGEIESPPRWDYYVITT
jgi:hypothetical protein